ncbi:hypothetical protein PRIEUP_LOCUS104 [Pristimantis euphronides]
MEQRSAKENRGGLPGYSTKSVSSLASGAKRVPVTQQHAAQAKQVGNCSAPQRVLCSANMPQRVQPTVANQKAQPLNQARPKQSAPVKPLCRPQSVSEDKDPASSSSLTEKKADVQNTAPATAAPKEEGKKSSGVSRTLRLDVL